MVLIVDRQDSPLCSAAPEPAPRSVECALRHMHWHFVPADASPLMQRRPSPLLSPRAAQEAP